MLLFFGPPGSGKSVQGKLLVIRNNWEWLSTGELFRESKDRAVLAKLASGELMDDKLTNVVLDKTLRQIPDKRFVVLDGYPRNTAQAEWLDEHLPEHGREIKAVILFQVDKDVLIERLNGRGRDEDKLEVIKHRLDIYDKQTQPVIKFYEKLGVPLFRIDGQGSPDVIHERIQEVVKACALV